LDIFDYNYGLFSLIFVICLVWFRKSTKWWHYRKSSLK